MLLTPVPLTFIVNLIENVFRYKDISPYDCTRVVLQDCPNGDYINANHVVMDVPGSGVVNRYIATQVNYNILHFDGDSNSRR